MKSLKKEVEKQTSKISKRERRELNRLNRVGDVSCRPAVFLSGKDRERKRRKGQLSSDIRKGVFD